MTVNLGHHPENITDNPNDPFGQPWSTFVQTLGQNPLNTFDLSMSPGTFATFSKFHLNTSNSPNTKVVYFVEGHNFHVEWHWRFGVEMRENAWSMPLGTIHWRPENNKLCLQFVQEWLRKTIYDLCKSCRGSTDLQLCYLAFEALQFKNFE
jgi:hypothetical protein